MASIKKVYESGRFNQPFQLKAVTYSIKKIFHTMLYNTGIIFKFIIMLKKFKIDKIDNNLLNTHSYIHEVSFST